MIILLVMVLILLILAVALVERIKMLSDIVEVVVIKDKKDNIYAEIVFADGGYWKIKNIRFLTGQPYRKVRLVHSIVERRVCGKRMMRIA